MATEWYYTRNGERYGPLSSRKIRRLARRGDLQPSDLLWKEGMEEWRPAGESPKLFASPSEGRDRRARHAGLQTPSSDDEADDHDIGLLSRLPLGDRPLLAAILAGVVAGLVAVGAATVVLIGIDRMNFLDQAHEGAEAPAVVRVRIAKDAADADAPPPDVGENAAEQADAGMSDPAATAAAAGPIRDEAESGRSSVAPEPEGRPAADRTDPGRLAVTMAETSPASDPAGTVVTDPDAGAAGERGKPRTTPPGSAHEEQDF